jgi:hypothetical protein
MAKKKPLKLGKHDIGRFVRVQFSDVGAQDGIIVNVFADNEFDLILLSNREQGPISNNGAPIVAFGNIIDAKMTGL